MPAIEVQGVDREATGSVSLQRSEEVVVDGLSEQARNRYLYVRALVGRDFASPAVRPVYN